MDIYLMCFFFVIYLIDGENFCTNTVDSERALCVCG